MSEQPVLIHLDANILKAAAIRVHRLRGHQETIDWGHTRSVIEVHKPYTTNRLDSYKNRYDKREQLRQTVFLPIVAYASIEGRLRLEMSEEAQFEARSLPRTDSVDGTFFGADVNIAKIAGTYRTRFYPGCDLKKLTLEFLMGFSDKRFLRLNELSGGFQGKNKAYMLNQSLDAYHLWAAEQAGAAYFLTMDDRFRKHMLRNKNFASPVSIVSPEGLVRQYWERAGLLRTIPFICRAALFARRKTRFESGQGWR